MVTQVYSDDNIIVYRWLSTDAKPLGCPHGSRGLEIDTLKRYIYDAPTSVWQDAIVNHDGGDQSPIDAYTKEQTQALLETKVDKQTGMGLSQENYTTAEKEKLSSLSPTTYDQTPTSGSSNPVTSNGIYNALVQKQDHLTFDPTPTANSSRPVTSGGVYQALAGKQGSLVFDQTPTDSSTNPVTSGGIYTDQQRQETEIGVVANTGAKNLLPMTHVDGSITRYGVTCTWDSNSGTMTLNGTHSSSDSAAIFEFYDGSAENTKILPAGVYKLTGCPAGGSTSTYRATLSQIAGAVDIGSGAAFELSEPHYAAYRILVSGDVTFNNMVFEPMLRPASITDSTFVPYAPTNRELYETCETKVTMQQAYGDAISIPANSDLNNYATPGLYYALVANVPTIINTPYNATGLRLVVEKNTPSGATVFQTIYPTSRSHLEFYRRIYEGGSWSSWYKFEGTPVTT